MQEEIIMFVGFRLYTFKDGGLHYRIEGIDIPVFGIELMD